MNIAMTNHKRVCGRSLAKTALMMLPSAMLRSWMEVPYFISWPRLKQVTSIIISCSMHGTNELQRYIA